MGVAVTVAVGVTVGVGVGAGPARHCENSEVFPAGSVAVDVMTVSPAGTGSVTLKLPLHVPSVTTVAEPRYVRPGP